uniref:Uncharacterized protein n=1 Tax=Aegilops tauschii TaxID=37682 RepID=M8C385_AEGTA
MAAVQICILSSSSRTASRWWAPHLLPSQDSGVLADVLPASSPSQDPAVARQERKPVVGILPPSPLRLRIKAELEEQATLVSVFWMLQERYNLQILERHQLVEG